MVPPPMEILAPWDSIARHIFESMSTNPLMSTSALPKFFRDPDGKEPDAGIYLPDAMIPVSLRSVKLVPTEAVTLHTSKVLLKFAIKSP